MSLRNISNPFLNDKRIKPVDHLIESYPMNLLKALPGALISNTNLTTVERQFMGMTAAFYKWN